MTTTIKIPLRSLNPAVVRELQEKYPDAEINVELHRDRTRASLSEQHFWEIIALFDWSKESTDEEVIEPAIIHLAGGPLRHIFEFADLLSEKLYALDGRKFAENIGSNSWSAGRHFSVDNFLYARCCAIANGKDLYEQILLNPATMPKDCTFETLLYVAAIAFERKTGRSFNYTPAYPIETYSNTEGWKIND